MAGILQGKRFLITGVASDHSIATGAAVSLHEHGAELAYTYQNERLQPRVEKLAQRLGGGACFPCDVSEDESIDAVMASLKEHWPDGFDGFFHSIAFAPGDQLAGRFTDAVHREGFRMAHDISSYSLVALAKAAKPQLRAGSAIVAMTFDASVRAVAKYNVMGLAKASLEAGVRFLALDLGEDPGVRVNAISAGPIRTLAASGISGFKSLVEHSVVRSALGRQITTKEVGDTAAFLFSDMASGVTGTIIYVDAGSSCISLHPRELEQ